MRYSSGIVFLKYDLPFSLNTIFPTNTFLRILKIRSDVLCMSVKCVNEIKLKDILKHFEAFLLKKILKKIK